MAFQTSSAQNNNVRPFGNTRNNDDSWKADGFINLYLPTKSGGRRKLGAIPLKGSRPSEAELLSWLNEDPSRVQKILAKLEMEYYPAGGTEDAAFDL